MNWHSIEPVDVLFLRGNKLFGDPGSYGEALIPPWPSAAAGAIRSAILARDGVDLNAFANGEIAHPSLGKPEAPGPFCVTAFRLARRVDGRWEMLFPQPSDLVVSKNDAGDVLIHRLQPQAIGHGIQSSMPTEKLPVLTQDGRSKPDSGWWLTEEGWKRYLAGETPTVEQMVKTDALWTMDERIGVGIEAVRGRADDGKLFTVQAVAFQKNVAFLAATDGDELENETLLRFGGDGRAALCRKVDYTPPRVDLDAIVQAGRVRIVLTAPGIFGCAPLPRAGEGEKARDDLPGRDLEKAPLPEGEGLGRGPAAWLPFACDAEGRFEFAGVRGRVVAAAVGRAETISGWDLARWRPKDARRVAPIGSVYWIEDLQASADRLHKLVKHGLWPEEGYDAQRKAEGFNRFEWGQW